jgi:hypothetical protein
MEIFDGLFDGSLWSNEWQRSWILQLGLILEPNWVLCYADGSGFPNLDIYKSLGYDSHMQFSLNLVSQCISAVSAWTAVSVADRLPRRKALVIGTGICCLMLAANAGFSAKWATCKSWFDKLIASPSNGYNRYYSRVEES